MKTKKVLEELRKESKSYEKPTAFQEYKSDIKLFAGYLPHLFVRLANFILDSTDEIKATISNDKFFKRWEYRLIFFVGAFFIVTISVNQIKLCAGEVIAEYPHTKLFLINKLIKAEEVQASNVQEMHTPQIEEVAEIVEEDSKVAEFFAYNSEVAQTDSDPFTMASGKRVYEGAIANNCLPFGTKIEVNGKVKIVEDRMNSRYGCDTFDIWMESYDEAISFGRRNLEYKILK